jgi:hypothetical protein
MKYTYKYLQRISSLCVWNMIDMAAHALTATAWAEYDPFTFCFTFTTGGDNVLECRRCIYSNKCSYQFMLCSLFVYNIFKQRIHYIDLRSLSSKMYLIPGTGVVPVVDTNPVDP